MIKTHKRRKIKNLMSKSINVFPARKSLDKITYTESPLEADLCYHLEYDSKIVAYQAQPLSFSYFFEDKVHEYSPDFEVFYQDGTSSYVEVKYIADIERIDNFTDWELALRDSAIRQGKGFLVLKEDFIRYQPLYENLQTLYSASNVNLDKNFLIHLISKFKNSEKLLISDLLTSTVDDNQFEQIYRLIFEKKLVSPIKTEILSKFSTIKQTGASYDCYL